MRSKGIHYQLHSDLILIKYVRIFINWKKSIVQALLTGPFGETGCSNGVVPSPEVQNLFKFLFFPIIHYFLQGRERYKYELGAIDTFVFRIEIPLNSLT